MADTTAEQCHTTTVSQNDCCREGKAAATAAPVPLATHNGDYDAEEGSERELAMQDMIQKAQEFDFVRLTFCDLSGVSRCRSIPKKHLESFFLEGGFRTIEFVLMGGCRGDFFPDYQDCYTRGGTFGNVAMAPEPGTLHALPWAGGADCRVGEVLCEPRWLPDMSYQESCPRHVARRQLRRLEQLGYQLYASFEAEFVLLKADGKPLFTTTNYMSSLVLSHNEKLLYDLSTNLIKADVDVESVGVELDWGQFEITTKPTTGVRSADMMFVLRESTREIAQLNELSAHFMSVPYLPSQSSGKVMSNGLHFNHSMVDKDGQNPFHDARAPDGLSELWRHWMGGLAAHSAALEAFYCPTVNCYRRNHYELFPKGGDWAIEDRKVAFRVKNHSKTETYVECRLPSGPANPYLVMAATLAAGLDGVARRLDCPPPRDPQAPTLPTNLESALQTLEQDTILCEALGGELIRCFVNSRRRIDIKMLPDSRLGDMDDKLGFAAEWDMYQHL